jgi:hypothetical protein
MGLLRVAVIFIGAVIVVVGIGFLLAPGGYTAGIGIYGVVIGALLVGAGLLERSRYRSAHAETTSAAPGPGGGEPTDRPMETRFRRTDERFIDPTTNRPMRVWIDPETGERRYRAED